MFTIELFVPPGALSPQRQARVAERLGTMAIVTEDMAAAETVEAARDATDVIIHEPATWFVGRRRLGRSLPPRYLARVSVPGAWRKELSEHLTTQITRALADLDENPERLYREPQAVVQVVGVPEGSYGLFGRTCGSNDVADCSPLLSERLAARGPLQRPHRGWSSTLPAVPSCRSTTSRPSCSTSTVSRTGSAVLVAGAPSSMSTVRRATRRDVDPCPTVGSRPATTVAVVRSLVLLVRALAVEPRAAVPVMGMPGRPFAPAGVNRRSESQRCRQLSPTCAAVSTTAWSIPARSRCQEVAGPACPAPTTSTSTDREAARLSQPAPAPCLRPRAPRLFSPDATALPARSTVLGRIHRYGTEQQYRS